VEEAHHNPADGITISIPISFISYNNLTMNEVGESLHYSDWHVAWLSLCTINLLLHAFKIAMRNFIIFSST
jgi:hypothetical protein